MDGTSPIDAFLIGRLSEDELLAEVDRVMVEGSQTDRTDPDQRLENEVREDQGFGNPPQT